MMRQYLNPLTSKRLQNFSLPSKEFNKKRITKKRLNLTKIVTKRFCENWYLYFEEFTSHEKILWESIFAILKDFAFHKEILWKLLFTIYYLLFLKILLVISRKDFVKIDIWYYCLNLLKILWKVWNNTIFLKMNYESNP